MPSTSAGVSSSYRLGCNAITTTVFDGEIWVNLGVSRCFVDLALWDDFTQCITNGIDVSPRWEGKTNGISLCLLRVAGVNTLTSLDNYVALSNTLTNDILVVSGFGVCVFLALGQYRTICKGEDSIEINNLKAVSWIYSLAEVPFPVFELEDTESKQLLTAINLEWKSPRIQMDVVIDIDGSEQWQRIAAYSLLNSSPYPYREYTLGDHTLGDNAMLGLQVRAVGFGLLQNSSRGNDKVTAYADLTRVITIEKNVDTSQKITNTISNIASTIVNSNVNRRGITFFNSSSVNVYVDTNSSVTTGSYLVKLEPGDYWEPPIQSYTGAYYGIIASGSTGIDIREFV
ncbi:MAG: hypothetical protein V7K63_08730 [Nostoc sp.]